MSHNNSSFTIGLDLGDQFNTFCILDADGEIVHHGQAANQRASMSRFLRRYAGATVVMETGSHSPWLSRLCADLEFRVLVGNSRKLRAIYQNPGKCDEADAEMLARIGRFDPRLLCPIVHRGAQAQADLAMLKARDQLVSARSSLICHVRSMVKSVGERLPKCSAPSFAKKVRPEVPLELAPALDPLLETIELLTFQIRQFGRDLTDLALARYPETADLAQIKGVGPITSLAFVLTIEDPVRFQNARDVGAWLGLTPRRDQSGASDRDLSISKAGNSYLRRLLVECARYIMGPFGQDCDLRRHGLKLMGLPPTAANARISARTSKAKNRAVVAVARKLSVLSLVLWRRRDTYQPLRHAA